METKSESPESLSRLACVETSHKHLFAVAITADDGHDYFFSTAQFLDAQLERSSGIHEDEKQAPERLLLRYATAEILILGRSLSRLAYPLQRGEVESLKPLGRRYAEVRQSGPVISSITVTRKTDL